MNGPEHELMKLARELPRGDFSKRFPHLFLLVRGRDEEEPIASDPPDAIADGRGPTLPMRVSLSITFRTLTGVPDQQATAEIHHVLPVIKRESNPYPERISVGRARNCDVVLRNRSVSKLHAHFRHTADGKLEIVDVQSHNGTYLNGATLSPNVGEVVASGDELQFGAALTQLVDAATLYDLLHE